MPTPILQQMLGQGGTMEFIDGAVDSKNYDFLVVNSACELSQLTGSVGAEDLLAAYNLSGKTISAGIVISGRNGSKILAVDVASGSVIGYTFL